MSKSVEKRMPKATQDLRKEFEEWCMKKSIVIIKPPARTNASAPYQYVNVWVQTAYEGFCAGYESCLWPGIKNWYLTYREPDDSHVYLYWEHRKNLQLQQWRNNCHDLMCNWTY